MNSLQKELTPMEKAWLPLKHLADRIKVVRWRTLSCYVRVVSAQDGWVVIIHPRSSTRLTIPITEVDGYSLDSNIRVPTLNTLATVTL